MTAMGHERRFGSAPTVSQLPPIADIETDVGAVEKNQPSFVTAKLACDKRSLDALMAETGETPVRFGACIVFRSSLLADTA
jgi:hypothetical protein